MLQTWWYFLDPLLVPLLFQAASTYMVLCKRESVQAVSARVVIVLPLDASPLTQSKSISWPKGGFLVACCIVRPFILVCKQKIAIRAMSVTAERGKLA